MSELSDRERADRAQTSLALEDLAAANHESNKTMIALMEHVRRETEARDRKLSALEQSQRQMRRFTQVIVVAVVCLLVIGGVNAWNLAVTKNQQRQQADIGRQVAQTNQNMLDCINGTGDCGKRNAEIQGKLLDDVKLYELTGFYCIRRNPAAEDPGAEAFLKCMKDLYPSGPTLGRG